MPYKLNDAVALDYHDDFGVAEASENAQEYTSAGTNLRDFVTELESVLNSTVYQIDPRDSNVAFQTQARAAVTAALANQPLNDASGTAQTDWQADFMMRSEQGPGGWGFNQYFGFFKLTRAVSSGRETYQDGANTYVFVGLEIVNY